MVTELPARTLAIVLNWQQPEVTLTCVRRLRAMDGPLIDILVIDNGSADNSVATFELNADLFMLQSLNENRGFAAGNNLGLQKAIEGGYDYALLVNNDAFAAPDMLLHLMAETAPDIGLLSPKIYYESDPQRLWFANSRRHALTLDLLETGKDEIDSGKWQFNRDVDYLLGTCLLVNLEAVQKVGLLDEKFFFYFEDLDWSIRFVEAGYKLRLVAQAHIYHQVALSTGGQEDTPLRRYHLAKSSILFWRKHAKKGNPAVIFVFRLFSAIKMTARLVLTGRIDVATAYWRGLHDGWRIDR